MNVEHNKFDVNKIKTKRIDVAFRKTRLKKRGKVHLMRRGIRNIETGARYLCSVVGPVDE